MNDIPKVLVKYMKIRYPCKWQSNAFANASFTKYSSDSFADSIAEPTGAK